MILETHQSTHHSHSLRLAGASSTFPKTTSPAELFSIFDRAQLRMKMKAHAHDDRPFDSFVRSFNLPF